MVSSPIDAHQFVQMQVLLVVAGNAGVLSRMDGLCTVVSDSSPLEVLLDSVLATSGLSSFVVSQSIIGDALAIQDTAIHALVLFSMDNAVIHSGVSSHAQNHVLAFVCIEGAILRQLAFSVTFLLWWWSERRWTRLLSLWRADLLC